MRPSLHAIKCIELKATLVRKLCELVSVGGLVSERNTFNLFESFAGYP
jgi:hypothetical protein